MDRDYILHIEHATKIFTLHCLRGKKIYGFNNINLTVKHGESIGISGKNGSGKSSLLKCIYRTYLLSEGNIWYNSRQFGWIDLTRAPEHLVHLIRINEIGYVSQFLHAIPRVSALDIVAEPLLRRGFSLHEAKSISSSLLERFSIPENLHDAYPSTFSGGEQQKVNIAKAIVWRPRLLLLDEPTASLDVNSISAVMEVLKELREQGTTMLGIFHDAGIMKTFADTVFNMK